MRTADEWIRFYKGHFDPECDECRTIIEMIQKDAQKDVIEQFEQTILDELNQGTGSIPT